MKTKKPKLHYTVSALSREQARPLTVTEVTVTARFETAHDARTFAQAVSRTTSVVYRVDDERTSPGLAASLATYAFRGCEYLTLAQLMEQLRTASGYRVQQ